MMKNFQSLENGAEKVPIIGSFGWKSSNHWKFWVQEGGGMAGKFQTLEKEAARTSNPWKSYPACKDSGVPWLGKVPEHWDLRPAFGAYFPTLERNRGMKEQTVLSLSYGRIIVKPQEKLHGLVPESFETYQIVNPGDIVLRTTDLQNDHTSLRVGKVLNRGIITSAYLNLRVKEGVLSDYGYQFMNVWDTTKAIYGFGSGLRQNLDFTHFKRMPVPVPPLPEQASIVKFLDYQDQLIRKYIGAKQKMIALLTEQKQAIIQRAVTRGLNPDVKMKPSGVDWLGEIPEHWEVSRVKNEFDCLNNIRVPLSGSERGRMKSHVYDYYGASGVIDKVDDYLFEDELLLIAEDGANLVLRNLPLAIVARGRFWVNNHAHILKPKRGVLDYLAHLMETVDYNPWISGAAQPKLTKDRLLAIPIPVPSAKEQMKILSQINVETRPLNDSITHIQHQMALMKEYRTRLISDVVTGKVDVRDVAKDLPEPEEVVETGQIALEAGEDETIAENAEE